MKIASIEILIVKIPKKTTSSINVPLNENTDYYKHPQNKAIYSTKHESLMIKVTTECGLIGWGEALSPIAPEVTGELIKKILMPILLGEDPRNIDVLWNRMYDSMRERGFFSGYMVTAMAAVDIALWDLLGKSVQLPIYQLLGGAQRKHIHAYVSGLPTIHSIHSSAAEKERSDLALKWKEAGFDAIKLHLGYGIQKDVQCMRAVREAVGDNMRLMVDAHQQYTVSQAIQLGRHLERLNVDFLEAPVSAEDILGIAEVSRALDMAVAVGEEIRTRYEFKDRIHARAGDIYQPDMGWVGISELRKIANMSEAFNIPIAPHLSAGLGICIAATLHVCANINNFYILEFQPNVMPTANMILQHSLICEKGSYVLPEGPGLGVTIYEEIVKQYARVL
jgi:L-alanine-DL-glutamate epimerase-like enolase superfamily enzyme